MSRLENFAGNEKFWIFAFKIICLSQNTTGLLCAVVDSLESKFSKQKYSRFIGLSFVREIPVLFDMVYAGSAVGVCVLG
jgi:hypothetical protein